MGFIAGLMPGIRDARTPLLVGWVWLAALWLLLQRVGIDDDLRHDLPDESIPSWLTQNRPVLALVVASAVAYTLGSVATRDPSRGRRMNPATWSRVQIFLEWKLKRWTPIKRLPPRDLYGFVQYIRPEDKRRVRRWIEEYPPEEYEGIPSSAVEHDVGKFWTVFDPQAAAVRLHLANREVWDQYDRLLAEAELRLSLVPALAALTFAVSANVQAGPAALVTISGMLFAVAALEASGHNKAQSANSVLLTAYIAGVIGLEESPES